MGRVFRLLRIDVGSGEYWVEDVDWALGPVDVGVRLHFEVYRSWSCGVFEECNAVVFGFGPFSLGKLVGANRVSFVFRSPVSMGLHVSSMGGAAWAMARAGVDVVSIEGRAAEESAVFIWGGSGGLRVEVEPLGPSGAEALEAGTRRLQEYLASRARSKGLEGELRVMAVGPAARGSRIGGVFSSPLEGGRLSPVVDSASRGGAGSVLLRAHGVAGIVMGGTARAPGSGAPEIGVVDSAVRELLGSRYPAVVLAKTRKYRFDPKLGTGGTFGVNYVVYRELVPAFAYNTIYLSHAVRARLHRIIMEYFWSPFQEEVFKGSPAGKWKTCGEPCPVACKKIWRGVKVDYEPFHGMGPMIGVVLLDKSAGLVEEADRLGVDAIEAGHVIGWVFDVVSKGLLHPSQAGLSAPPAFDPVAFDPVEGSERNAALARALLEDLARGADGLAGLAGREGLRRAARLVEEEYGFGPGGVSPRDLAVYAAFGGDGYMTPNYYWTPGMVAPLYILGRYWTNYTPTFMEPEEYAESSLQRALWEYSIDNAGFCRFHRGWAEKVLPRLYDAVGLATDPVENARTMYSMVARYQELAGAEPVPWESRKTMDLVASIAAEVGRTEWADRIASDPSAAREWWTRFYRRLRGLLAGG